VNYHDTRDWLSAYVDEGLSADERTEIDAHLRGCGECRGDLDRFRQTLALLHRLDRPRAPVGFVERVLTRARPLPWYRRWLARVFLPWPVKVPIEAAALVMLSLGAVYLFQRTPELRQAAREEAPQSMVQPEIQTPPPAAPAPDEFAARSTERAPQGEAESDRLTPRRKVAGVKPRLPSSAPVTPSESVPAPSIQGEVKKQEEATGNVSAPRSAELRAPVAQSPAPPPAQSRSAVSKERAERAQDAASPGRSPSAAAKSALDGVIVAGRLTVKDRQAAERALSGLLKRLKATELSRRRDSSGLVVEVLVPKDAYPALTRELRRIGAWTLEAEPTELPAQVPVRLRLLK
jgi:hypothetical protein